MSGVAQKEMVWRHESNVRVITSAGRANKWGGWCSAKTGSVAGASRSASKSVTACMRVTSAVPGSRIAAYGRDLRCHSSQLHTTRTYH